MSNLRFKMRSTQLVFVIITAIHTTLYMKQTKLRFDSKIMLKDIGAIIGIDRFCLAAANIEQDSFVRKNNDIGILYIILYKRRAVRHLNLKTT